MTTATEGDVQENSVPEPDEPEAVETTPTPPDEPTPEGGEDDEPATPETAEAVTEEPAEKPKRTRKPGVRGELETNVKKVCDDFITGSLSPPLPEGEHLTPHRIAREIQRRTNAEKPPSSGAVAAVLDRWVEYNFASVTQKPKAFEGYTEAARTEGLTALKARHAEAKRAEKRSSGSDNSDGDADADNSSNDSGE